MNWIKVEDKLPEKDVPVLCLYDDYMDVMEYWYDDGECNPIFMRPPAPPVDNVTHWMPLPQPPEDS